MQGIIDFKHFKETGFANRGTEWDKVEIHIKNEVLIFSL